MDKLSDLIKGRMDAHALSSSAKSSEVLYKANIILNDLFGESQENVKAYRFERGILYITTKNAVWSQEVWGVQESVLKSLIKQFGERVVKKVLIKMTADS